MSPTQLIISIALPYSSAPNIRATKGNCTNPINVATLSAANNKPLLRANLFRALFIIVFLILINIWSVKHEQICI